MSASGYFTTGISELDKEFPGIISRGDVVVIAGHPGSGKTTFAATICYNNVLRNEKCLYVSFQESKEKMYRNMSKLGIRLKELEKSGLVKHVHLPVTTLIEEVASKIAELVSEFRPSIIIIDSVNPLMTFISTKAQRAWLHNFFCNLTAIENSALILIAELPHGKESLSLGDIEFVADTVIQLKYITDAGKLVRVMEIKKARGNTLRVVEIPFRIIEKKGIRVFIPPALGKGAVPAGIVTSSTLIGKINAGDVILFTHPPEVFPPLFGYLVSEMALRGKAKTLGIVYSYEPNISEHMVIEHALRAASGLDASGKPEALHETLLKKIKRYISFEMFNPYGTSLEETVIHLLERVEAHKAKILVLGRVEVFEPVWRTDPRRYLDVLANFLLTLKKKGIVILRRVAKTNIDFVKLQQSLANIIIDYEYELDKETGQLKEFLIVSRKGQPPKVIKITPKFIDEYRQTLAKLILELVKE